MPLPPLTFYLQNWAAWAPGLQTVDDWRTWAAAIPGNATSGQDSGQSSGNEIPAVKDIPMMTRRRLARLGRMALRVALDAGSTGAEHLVFASRYGDSRGTGELMRNLAREKALSPTDFSMSVHNAYAGVLSILQNNSHSHTAICAGEESFCAGLLEAALILRRQPDRAVLLVYYDEPLAPVLRGQEAGGADLALALKLSGDQGQMMHMGTGEAAGNLPPAGTQFPANPQLEAPAHAFLRYLAGEAGSWSWRGRRGGWWCRRDD